MPKLDAAKAKQVAEQESSSFEPIPEDIYTVKLREVKVGESRKGNAMWTWEVEIDEGDYSGRRQWINTSLLDTADWKMKEVFEAFGYTTDSDTDEMIGERCRIVVVQRTIESGANAGKLGNNVDKCLPLDSDGDAEDGDDEF